MRTRRDPLRPLTPASITENGKMTNTTFKPLPVVLDRLAHALNAQGIKLKRSQLLEISAAAFGYRNSNELTAAAKAGDLNPPPAQVIGRVELPDGQSVIIVNDQFANSPYAIDEAFLEQVAAEERREEIGITPYGHLAALYDVLDAENIPEIAGGTTISDVHIARISHQHGDNIYVAIDDDGLTMQIAEYARENWSGIADYATSDDMPEFMTDNEVVEAYFEICQNHEIEEYLETSVETVMARIRPEVQKVPTIPNRYALQHEMDNEPIYIVDRHKQDEDNEYLTIAELPRTEDPMDDIALAQKIIDGLNGNAVPNLAPGHVLESDLLSIASTLEDGATADIWYDAHEYMDEDNEEDEDTIANYKIGSVQQAMLRAASIFEKMATRNPADRQVSIHAEPEKSEDTVLERQELEPVWITDSQGYDTGQVSASHMSTLGLDFHKDREDTLPLTEKEYELLLAREILNKDSEYRAECGFSVLYKNAKWLAPEVGFSFDSEKDGEREASLEKARAYAEGKKAEIEAIGGHIVLTEDATDDEHEVTILLPFELAADSSDIADWKAALSYLLLPAAEQAKQAQVKCDFLPQVWLFDNAISVDPAGDTAWNGTFDALRWGRDFAERLMEEFVYDEYATEGAMTPKWIRNWTGVNPFEVEVIGLEAVFNLSS